MTSLSDAKRVASVARSGALLSRPSERPSKGRAHARVGRESSRAESSNARQRSRETARSLRLRLTEVHAAFLQSPTVVKKRELERHLSGFERHHVARRFARGHAVAFRHRGVSFVGPVEQNEDHERHGGRMLIWRVAGATQLLTTQPIRVHSGAWSTPSAVFIRPRLCLVTTPR